MREKNPFSQIHLEPIKQLLGELTPDLPPGPLGRLRLIEALRMKYGDQYRMISGARQAIEHFDSETDLIRGYMKAKHELSLQTRKDMENEKHG